MTAPDAHQKLKEGQALFYAEPPDFMKAAILFHEVTQIAPEWAEGHFWLASARLQQSGISEAAPAFRRAIELAPTDSRPHLWLDVGFELAGRFDDAVRCLRDGLALKPPYGEADSRIVLARVLKKSGRIEEAVAEWRIVEKMDAMYPSYDDPIQEAKDELKAHGHGP